MMPMTIKEKMRDIWDDLQSYREYLYLALMVLVPFMILIQGLAQRNLEYDLYIESIDPNTSEPYRDNYERDKQRYFGDY